MDNIVIGSHCTVQVIEEVPCVMIKWDGHPSSEEFRNGCNAALELMTKHKIIKVLTDNSFAKVFSVNDQRWLNEDWLVRAQKIGYKYSAVLIKDADPFVTFAVKNIMAKRDSSKFMAKFFTSYPDAIDWLKIV